MVVADGVLRTRWQDDAANLLRVWLAPGASAAEVRARTIERLGAGYYVLSGSEFVAGVRDVLGQFFRTAQLLVVVSTFIGVIGIVNTQVATMLDRARANATLYTIGIPLRAIAAGVLVECGLLGALGGVLGVGVGLVLAFDLLSWSLPLLTGWRLPLLLPYRQFFAGILTAVLVSALAGYVPARAATRLQPGTRSVD